MTGDARQHDDPEFHHFDRLADLAADPQRETASVSALAAEVAMDFRRRQKAAESLRIWSTAGGADRAKPARDVPWFPGNSLIIEWIATLAVISAIGWLAAHPRVVAAVAALAALPVAIFLFVIIVKHYERRKRRRALVTGAHCPACRYDLTGLPDAIPHAWIAAHSGPRRCPECGRAWPTVPPDPDR